jgi:hypothetical protein
MGYNKFNFKKKAKEKNYFTFNYSLFKIFLTCSLLGLVPESELERQQLFLNSNQGAKK